MFSINASSQGLLARLEQKAVEVEKVKEVRRNIIHDMTLGEVKKS